MKKQFARTIIWLGLVGFSILFYSTGWYEDVSPEEIIAGAYYSGWALFTHWLIWEKMIK